MAGTLIASQVASDSTSVNLNLTPYTGGSIYANSSINITGNVAANAIVTSNVITNTVSSNTITANTITSSNGITSNVITSTASPLVLQANGSTIATISSGGATLSSLTANAYVPATSLVTNSTAVATTSGTSISFTGIPSWAKRITIILAGTVLSSSANRLFQLGSGSYQTTGYQSQGCYFGSGTSGQSVTNGFQLYGDGSSSYNTSGMITFTLLNSATNLWVGNGVFTCYTNVGLSVAGQVTLTGVLDRVRIYTTSGTDTFTAGSANIFYE